MKDKEGSNKTNRNKRRGQWFYYNKRPISITVVIDWFQQIKK